MKTGKNYWRSLEQLAETPKFREWLHREFPAGASELAGSTSRRRVLQLMAASCGLSGLTACRRPTENILPATYGSEEIVPGMPLWYATGMTVGGFTGSKRLCVMARVTYGLESPVPPGSAVVEPLLKPRPLPARSTARAFRPLWISPMQAIRWCWSNA